jgi:hypothetical protein
MVPLAELLAERRMRRRANILLAVAVGLMVLAGVASASWQERQASRARHTEAEFEAELERREVVRQKTDQRRARAESARASAEAERARVEAERAAAVQQARERVPALLNLSTEMRRRSLFLEAQQTLEQVWLLAPEDLKPAVEQAKADLAFVRELSDIRRMRSVKPAEPGGSGRFDTASAYRESFRARGFDLAQGIPAETAARISTSPIKGELVAALNDWADFELDSTLRARLLEVARRAGPDSKS